MDTKVIQRISHNLIEKRQNLLDWLLNTPVAKRQVYLGEADEQAVQVHLRVLDTALEKAENQTLGVCEVCHETIEPERLEMDYTCCVCLEDLSAEEVNQLEFELEFSAKVQQALLPQQLPEIPGLDFAAFSRPAEIVGGDYFDFLNFRLEANGFVIGDVAGHGISASLLMASIQASLRAITPESDSPTNVVRRLNQLFIHNIHLTSFVTLFLARYDSETRSLNYCSAGHNPPLLFTSPSGQREPITWLYPTGAAIGLVEDNPLTGKTVPLSPGDILLLYTDGVTEAINSQEEEFGMERLAGLIQQNPDWSAHEVVQGVLHRLKEFTSDKPLEDDATIVACKVEEL